MRKLLTLSIPEPCHEDWNKMTPEEQGRHCLNCQKTVFDFTKSSDEQIIETITKDKNICGRYISTQLNRELVLNRKERNNYLSWLASGLFALMSFNSQTIFAQSKPAIVKVENAQNLKDNPSLNELIEVKGHVKDNYGPLPGVNVHIKGTSKFTQTDFDGNYKIWVNEGATLIYSFIGYNILERKIQKNLNHDVSLIENVNLEDCEIIMMGALKIDSNFTLGQDHNKRISKNERRHKIRTGEIKRNRIGKLLFALTNPFRKKD